MHVRQEMLDLIVVDGHAKGIITRNLSTGELKVWTADAVLLCTGGYGNVYYKSTNAIGCNVTANFRAYRRGPGLRIPVLPKFIQPVYLSPETTSPNYLECRNPCVTTDAYGFPKMQKTVAKHLLKFPKMPGITTWSENTQVLVT
jgi:hypothetical protein